MTPVFPKAFSHNEVHFTTDDCEARVEPKKVMLCKPDYFDVKDVKNVYMENQNGKVDTSKAQLQWDQLHAYYLQLKNQKLVDEVYTIDGVEGLEDMVFCANQSFPWVMWNNEKIAIMSRMRHEARQHEIPYIEDFYKDQGYKIVDLQSKYHFEGMGDLIPHPTKRLAYGGYGFRTDKNAYDEISRILDAPIITLELINDNYYHLDTCFLPLNHAEVMIAPEAFAPESIQLIKKLFEGVYEIPEEESLQGFACNAHIVYDQLKNRQSAIIQRGNPNALNMLQQNTAITFETETSEFMKSGGSVFCMKMMVY